ncbi:tRNA methyltransferase 10 homolog A-like [Schistocerca gregaria]|uniref:tRNA methyltransferase 10 homolog A-like n=1 Tax=Schistocerca gregaria TaxID=7010 RepID=UPI00211DB332|nr:tRNA methyltransferase 10 homolog A-like [Schistocerca gregaria]
MSSTQDGYPSGRNPDEGEEGTLCDRESPLSAKRLSKAEKKQLRQALREAHWKTHAPKERENRRRNRSARISAMKAAGKDPSVELPTGKKNIFYLRKKRPVDQIVFSNIRVVIDLSFDHLMNDRAINSLVTQVSQCYATNRKLECPLQLHLTGFGQRFQQKITSLDGFEKWAIKTHSESYLDLFPRSDLVYLCDGSENVLRTLEADKVYVIGGLVDHNQHKGICYNLALENHIETARLPLEVLSEMKACKVLTVNQVFQILSDMSVKTDWKECLQLAIPKRKYPNSVQSYPNPEKKSEVHVDT